MSADKNLFFAGKCVRVDKRNPQDPFEAFCKIQDGDYSMMIHPDCVRILEGLINGEEYVFECSRIIDWGALQAYIVRIIPTSEDVSEITPLSAVNGASSPNGNHNINYSYRSKKSMCSALTACIWRKISKYSWVQCIDRAIARALTE